MHAPRRQGKRSKQASQGLARVLASDRAREGACPLLLQHYSLQLEETADSVVLGLACRVEFYPTGMPNVPLLRLSADLSAVPLLLGTGSFSRVRLSERRCLSPFVSYVHASNFTVSKNVPVPLISEISLHTAYGKELTTKSAKGTKNGMR